ncbi:hypothetical protein Fmac_027756 [Flemingia macrophylla]|uniref:Uncharacterized protein n=1 Tax=Flemingia macrophylla TaxID=520843 RepID=A0ABD1LIM6_9FABA
MREKPKKLEGENPGSLEISSGAPEPTCDAPAAGQTSKDLLSRSNIDISKDGVAGRPLSSNQLFSNTRRTQNFSVIQFKQPSDGSENPTGPLSLRLLGSVRLSFPCSCHRVTVILHRTAASQSRSTALRIYSHRQIPSHCPNEIVVRISIKHVSNYAAPLHGNEPHIRSQNGNSSRNTSQFGTASQDTSQPQPRVESPMETAGKFSAFDSSWNDSTGQKHSKSSGPARSNAPLIEIPEIPDSFADFESWLLDKSIFQGVTDR